MESKYLKNWCYLCTMITQKVTTFIATALFCLTSAHAQHVAYRSTAHYNKRVAQFEQQGGIDSTTVVMLGNSLTENGKDWGQRFGMHNVVNRGIIGDNTTGMRERLCQITPHHPRAIFLMAGINDMSNGTPAADVANRVIGLIGAAVARHETFCAEHPAHQRDKRAVENAGRSHRRHTIRQYADTRLLRVEGNQLY